MPAQAAGRRDHRARDAGRARFRRALRERVALLAGLDEASSRAASPSASAQSRARRRWSDDARGGARRLLVSGGFTAFAEPIADAVGFDRVEANRLASRTAS
jgi:phosphoserine phosphatase